MLISPNATMTGSYDYGEVARSILIAIAASYAALDLAGRVTAARGRARAAWLAGGAIAMGIGIWSMHFKGMLAFHLPVTVAYHWPTVLVSLGVAVFASAVALYIVSRREMGPFRLWTGSFLMGGGIAALHYIGMSSMRLAAVCRFNLLIVALSVVLAIGFSLIALLMAFGSRDETQLTVRRRLGSALMMGAAISVMHYTGMAAASFIPSVLPVDLSHAVSISSLGNNGIAIVTLLVLGAAILTSALDRQTEAEVRRANERLEQRVVERTRQLTAVNEELRREIAERRRAEDALRRSEDHLRLVIDTIPALVWSKSPDGSADFLNQRFREYTGLSVEEGLGEGWLKTIHPKDRASSIDAWRAAFATGRLFEFESRLRRADGEYLWFLWRCAPLRDEVEKSVKWYGTTTDIDDRKRAEEQSRALIDAIPQQIWMLHPDDRERVLKAWRESVMTGTPYEQEERHRGADGEYRWFLALGVPLRDSKGRIARWYGTNTDITERKRAEAALQEAHANLARVTRVVAMGELAAAIAHEINQPLTAIVTNANFSLRELAGGGTNLEKLREAIAEIVADATRASAVISRIRTLLMKGAPDRTELDINEVIQETVVLVRDEVRRNRVSLQTDLADDLPRLLGDRVQLQQVLINLIMNGIDAMRSLTDSPRKLLIKSAKSPDAVLVQVQDTGTGLDPQNMERIFEPFFTTKPQGTGMGLAISRSVVESHGGRLWATGAPACGAIFQFTLPRA